MREILFRGLRKEYNTEHHLSPWKYGHLLNECSIGEVGIGLDSYSYAEVNPETVGQYTGLQDKHGKMIFEGDVVIQKYDNEKDCLEIIVEDIRNIQCLYIGSQSKSNEVIGNIHTNN